MATGETSALLADALIDLKAVYVRAMEEGKLQIALNARKEMNKVLDLERVKLPPPKEKDAVIPAGVDVERARQGLPDWVEKLGEAADA